MSGIPLSEKHGVNPSVDRCFICGKDYAVVLFGKMKGDVKAPMSVCTGGLCEECAKVKEAGAIFLIEIDEAKTTDMESPWRTGRIVGVTERTLRQMINTSEFADTIIEKGLAFLPIEVFESLGFPNAITVTEESNGQSE